VQQMLRATEWIHSQSEAVGCVAEML
jgi:hypothetical protein